MNETEERLCQAFKELVERQPVSSISIQAVCDRAGLSRKTFSRHFTEICDVAAAQIRSDFVEPVNSLNKVLPCGLLDNTVLIERNLSILEKNRQYYCSIVKAFGKFWLVDQMAQGFLNLDFEPYASNNLSEYELDFVEHCFANSMAMIFVWWMDRGFDIPAAAVAKLADTWLYAHFREIGRQPGYASTMPATAAPISPVARYAGLSLSRPSAV